MNEPTNTLGEIEALKQKLRELKKVRAFEIAEAKKRKEEIRRLKKAEKEKIEGYANFVIDNLKNKGCTEILKVISRVRNKIIKEVKK